MVSEERREIIGSGQHLLLDKLLENILKIVIIRQKEEQTSVGIIRMETMAYNGVRSRQPGCNGSLFGLYALFNK